MIAPLGITRGEVLNENLPQRTIGSAGYICHRDQVDLRTDNPQLEGLHARANKRSARLRALQVRGR